jgi:hypothetical protein
VAASRGFTFRQRVHWFGGDRARPTPMPTSNTSTIRVTWQTGTLIDPQFIDGLVVGVVGDRVTAVSATTGRTVWTSVPGDDEAGLGGLSVGAGIDGRG